MMPAPLPHRTLPRRVAALDAAHVEPQVVQQPARGRRRHEFLEREGLVPLRVRHRDVIVRAAEDGVPAGDDAPRPLRLASVPPRQSAPETQRLGWYPPGIAEPD